MSGDQPGSEPEDTLPFTHRPYGSGEPENPLTSPSGPASQPSGPGYVTPVPGEPPTAGPQYGPPVAGPPPGWQQAWAPVYGAPYPGSMEHKGAKASLVFGVIALASVLLTPFCCITFPGLFCAPVAWAVGAKAKREIDAAPGVYGNRCSAQAGFIMGIVCSVLGVLVIVLSVAFVLLVNSDWSLV